MTQPENKNRGVMRFFQAGIYSMQGLKAAYRHEEAFRQELFLAIVLIGASFFFDVTVLERLFMIAVVLLVLIVELLNSAVEAVVDRIGPERHELSGRAKDIGSAAVFIALCQVALVWGGILLW
ncbi:diacylglycerol kinase [Ferrimonas balearica]|uniref:diacylglycerol kinase n=1 Tax=Ferrimonas balearica TaxID=44012 RepID=UPI001C99B3CF|nr:diacylglycerol kinase [Ferrimonas balearica]MBY5923043.1 diacylglycerol kinase [Ferrimonas balearica]MBY5997581.1 diacylglycerol kinase [Ferrimonas balearica]